VVADTKKDLREELDLRIQGTQAEKETTRTLAETIPPEFKTQISEFTEDVTRSKLKTHLGEAEA
jgi:hypothetical protein